MPHYTAEGCSSSTSVREKPVVASTSSQNSVGHRVAPIGLSLSAYLTAPASGGVVRVHVGGTLVQTAPHTRTRFKVGGGMRGKVVGFSRASRRRLRVQLAKVKRNVIASALFVTLTYPAVYPDGPKCKKQFQTWCKRVERKFPHAVLVWRMELQERGAPHFHILVFGVKFIPYDWVARSWFEVVGSGRPEHLAAGTQVQRVRSYNEARSYVEKYIGKTDNTPLEDYDCGRIWGIRGELQPYLAPVEVLHLSRQQLARLSRILDGMRRAEVRSRKRVSGRAVRWSRRARSRPLTVPCTWYQSSDSWGLRVSDIVGPLALSGGS